MCSYRDSYRAVIVQLSCSCRAALVIQLCRGAVHPFSYAAVRAVCYCRREAADYADSMLDACPQHAVTVSWTHSCGATPPVVFPDAELAELFENF